MSISAIDSRPMVTCSPVAQIVQFARIGAGLNFLGQCDQLVGFAAHCGNDHHHLMALRVEPGNALGDILDALGISDRRAAVFLNNQRHGFIRLNVGNMKKEAGF
jgi:hypothetical protein